MYLFCMPSYINFYSCQYSSLKQIWRNKGWIGFWKEESHKCYKEKKEDKDFKIMINK